MLAACGGSTTRPPYQTAPPGQFSDLPPEPINPHPHFAGDSDGLIHVASESRALTGAASAGCGTTPPYAAGTYTTGLSITVGGVTRTFNLQVPSGYLNSVAQRTVYALPGRGGSGATMYSQGVWHTLSGIAIYLDSLPQTYCQGQTCWDHKTDGADMAFIDAIVAWVDAGYCIDTGRRVAYGFSAGAIFGNIMACVRAGTFAAFYSVEGLLATNTATFNNSNVNWDGGCSNPTDGGTQIGWGGQWNLNDMTIGGTNAHAQRDYMLAANGMTGDAGTTSEWDGSVHPVYEYTGGNPNPPGVADWFEGATGGHGWDGPYGMIACALYLSRF